VAAKDIKLLIDTAAQKVDTGTILVHQAGTTMEDIVSAVRHVSTIMGDIAAASQEQDAGIGQINQAVAQMDEATQQNAALVEQAAAAAASLAEQAHRLSQAISVFKLRRGDNALAVPAPRVAHMSAHISFKECETA
jgi:methyl-accepting chemotaxis protein